MAEQSADYVRPREGGVMFCMSGHEHRTKLLAMVCDEERRGPRTHLCPSCDVGLPMGCTCPPDPAHIDGQEASE